MKRKIQKKNQKKEKIWIEVKKKFNKQKNQQYFDVLPKEKKKNKTSYSPALYSFVLQNIFNDFLARRRLQLQLRLRFFHFYNKTKKKIVNVLKQFFAANAFDFSYFNFSLSYSMLSSIHFYKMEMYLMIIMMSFFF